jgi:hypothetical protein
MVIEVLDACAEALQANGLPCTDYQMWVDDDELVHYYFDFGRPLTPPEDLCAAVIFCAYLGTPG